MPAVQKSFENDASAKTDVKVYVTGFGVSHLTLRLTRRVGQATRSYAYDVAEVLRSLRTFAFTLVESYSYLRRSNSVNIRSTHLGRLSANYPPHSLP